MKEAETIRMLVEQMHNGATPVQAYRRVFNDRTTPPKAIMERMEGIKSVLMKAHRNMIVENANGPLAWSDRSPLSHHSDDERLSNRQII